jgi:catechol-2,3-dioxygenase
MGRMKIERIDHIVMTVNDVEKTCAFYTKVLGMNVVPSCCERKVLSFGLQKINLHQRGKEFQIT